MVATLVLMLHLCENNPLIQLCTCVLYLFSPAWWENFYLFKRFDSLLLLKHLRRFKRKENKKNSCQKPTLSTTKSNSLTAHGEMRGRWEDDMEQITQINQMTLAWFTNPFLNHTHAQQIKTLHVSKQRETNSARLVSVICIVMFAVIPRSLTGMLTLWKTAKSDSNAD